MGRALILGWAIALGIYALRVTAWAVPDYCPDKIWESGPESATGRFRHRAVREPAAVGCRHYGRLRRGGHPPSAQLPTASALERPDRPTCGSPNALAPGRIAHIATVRHAGAERRSLRCSPLRGGPGPSRPNRSSARLTLNVMVKRALDSLAPRYGTPDDTPFISRGPPGGDEHSRPRRPIDPFARASYEGRTRKRTRRVSFPAFSSSS
jgi:hypothetical protein